MCSNTGTHTGIIVGRVDMAALTCIACLFVEMFPFHQNLLMKEND